MRNFWNRRTVFILLLVAIGLFVRLWGINHGLPSSYYPDERHFINRAMSFGTGDLNPHWFHKPALYMYILFLEYGLFFLIGKLVGLFSSIPDFARLYINDLSVFLLIGRMTTVLFAAGTILLTYKVGRKMFGVHVGLIAALFLTLTFAHVKGSHDVKADVPTGFFAILSLLYIYNIVKTGELRHYCLAGFFAGLGVATKYSPIVLAVPILGAHLFHLLSRRPFRWSQLIGGKLLLAYLLLLVGFFIGAPYNFLDPYFFRSQVAPIFATGGQLESATDSYSISRILRGLLNPWLHFARVVLRPKSMGVLLGALSLLGIPFLLLRGKRSGWLVALSLLSFVYVANFLFGYYLAPRHLNAIFPFLVLGAAVIVWQVVGWILPAGFKASGSWRAVAAIFLSVLIVLPSAYRIIKFDALISQRDTRTIAKEWIEANIPAGTRIIVDDYCVPLRMSPERIKLFLEKAQRQEEAGPFTVHAAKYYRYYMEVVEEPTFQIYEISHPWWKAEEDVQGTYPLDSSYDRDMGNPLKEWGVCSLEHYRQEGYRYLVTTEELIERYSHGERTTGFPSFERFYRQVTKEAAVTKIFEPHSPQGPGPRVFLYQLSSEG